MVVAMTATADAPAEPAALTPTASPGSGCPTLDELSNGRPCKGFFARQQREEGLTSNWFRALSLNEGDLERLNGYLLPLLGTDGRGGLTRPRARGGRDRGVRVRTGAPTATPITPTSSARSPGDWSFGQRVAIDHHQVAELTDRERALADLAVAGQQRSAVDPRRATSTGCAELGLDDHQILEGISIAAFIGATNRIGIALSVPPNPEYTGIPGQ